MPQLKNKRHEIYCQAVVSGKTTYEAYVEAGYKPNPSNASNFKKKHPNIEERINELLKMAETDAVAKRKECCAILTEVIRDVTKSDTIRRKNIETLSKLLNWEKIQIETSNKPSEMTDEELERFLKDNE